MRRVRTGGLVRRVCGVILAVLMIGNVSTPPVGAAPMTQAAQTTAGDAAAGDTFGAALAMSADGTVALVGARGKNNYRGVAYLFARSPMGLWVEAGKLTANDWQAGDYFGAAVALSGDGRTALIGAFSANGRRGAAYAFVRGDTGWTQAAKLTEPDGKAGDTFGVAVALNADGSTAAIGAANAGETAGAVYVFVREGGAWSPQARLVADSPKMRDGLGSTVSISADGNTVLAGATGRNSNAGTAYVFARTGAGWGQSAQLRSDSVSDGDFFGWSVALSADGAIAVIGSPNRSSYRGTVYTFLREGASSWTLGGTLFVSDGAANDRFGNSVAISGSGETVLVGAPNKNGQTGSAYVFARIAGGDGTYVQQSKFTANDGMTGDRYGAAVAISGNGAAAFVGAAEKNDTRGTVYVYA